MQTNSSPFPPSRRSLCLSCLPSPSPARPLSALPALSLPCPPVQLMKALHMKSAEVQAQAQPGPSSKEGQGQAGASLGRPQAHAPPSRALAPGVGWAHAAPGSPRRPPSSTPDPPAPAARQPQQAAHDWIRVPTSVATAGLQGVGRGAAAGQAGDMFDFHGLQGLSSHASTPGHGGLGSLSGGGSTELLLGGGGDDGGSSCGSSTPSWLLEATRGWLSVPPGLLPPPSPSLSGASLSSWEDLQALMPPALQPHELQALMMPPMRL